MSLTVLLLLVQPSHDLEDFVEKHHITCVLERKFNYKLHKLTINSLSFVNFVSLVLRCYYFLIYNAHFSVRKAFFDFIWGIRERFGLLLILTSSCFGCFQQEEHSLSFKLVWLPHHQRESKRNFFRLVCVLLSVRSQSRSWGVIVVTFLVIILNLFFAVVVQLWECYLSWHANDSLIFTLFLWSHSFLHTFLSSCPCTSSIVCHSFMIWDLIWGLIRVNRCRSWWGSLSREDDEMQDLSRVWLNAVWFIFEMYVSFYLCLKKSNLLTLLSLHENFMNHDTYFISMLDKRYLRLISTCSCSLLTFHCDVKQGDAKVTFNSEKIRERWVKATYNKECNENLESNEQNDTTVSNELYNTLQQQLFLRSTQDQTWCWIIRMALERREKCDKFNQIATQQLPSSLWFLLLFLADLLLARSPTIKAMRGNTAMILILFSRVSKWKGLPLHQKPCFLKITTVSVKSMRQV